MLIEHQMAAALREHCRQSPRLDRAIKLLSQVSLTGATFSFFDSTLSDKQLSRVTSLYVKAGVIELVRPAVIGKVKAGYRLTEDWYTPEPDAVPVCVEYPDEFYTEDLEHPRPTEAELKRYHAERAAKEMEQARKDKARRYAAYKRQEFQMLKFRLGNRMTPSVEKVVRELQKGDRTKAELAKSFSSKSTMYRSLRVLKDTQMLSIAGAGRSPRTYSLVLPAGWSPFDF